MIDEISKKLHNTKELKKYFSLLKQGKDTSLAVVSSARPLVVASDFVANKRSILVIVPGDTNAKVFANELRKYLDTDDIIEFPSNVIYDKCDAFDISRTYFALATLSAAKAKIVVASASAVLRKFPDCSVDHFKPVKFIEGKEFKYNTLIENLKNFGYTRLEVLDGPGTFTLRGDTLDIFPAQLNYPVRVDFFGDEVEEIRRIVQSTGQTISPLKSVEIYSAKKIEEFEKTITLQKIINKSTIVYTDEPRGVLDDMRNFYDSLGTAYKISRAGKKTFFENPLSIDFSKNQNVSLVSIMQRGVNPDAKLTLKRPKKCKNEDDLNKMIAELRSDRWKVYTEIPASLSFLIPDAKIAVIVLSKPGFNVLGNHEFFDQGKLEFVDITKITFPYKPGDYVVHSFYGIAYFKDIVKREIGGSVRDYLLLEYAEKDKLYVPIEQFGRITKYVGPQGTKPKVTRLGTADWSSIMKKARKATLKMAFDLVDVYSRRAVAKGHAFSSDNKQQIKMENDFPYLETEDQQKAIEQVKADMQAIKPMDRLICGDVGFGKTEVALRAAFKCVQDKMQVMFLCPTTILAQQHYTTFTKRLEDYGVKIDALTRFKTNKESKQIAEDFASGKLDILIGTHRLLSRDINPKNLGLIIIDEEQRFGVGHKEQLKNFRDSVDVLTLTATPIPRTMQMATSGVRDMSLINTPPVNRKSVDVYVGEWDVDIVSDAIRREIRRGGQVYYVSNRVRTIKDAADRVGLAAGEAKIATIHGRMKKDQIESIMEDFSAGLFDVLVATTIIENGIDNPNTNTLIIEDSQNLGLAQMYQLKGRVGRSVEQAYAYFLFQDSAMLSKDTIARLEAIDEFKDLGSGVQIAMRDLEIRGSGNFLGAEQSGNVSHVGFDLFAQMLKSAVENAQTYERSNKTADAQDYLEPSVSDIAVNIPGSAYLSGEIIPEVEKRVLWYRRFSSAKSLDEVYMLSENLKKEFPEINDVCENFIFKSCIAAVGLKQGFNLISVVRGNLILEGKKLNATQEKDLKQIEGSYYARKAKITIPLDRIIDKEPDLLFGQIFDFLINWDF